MKAKPSSTHLAVLGSRQVTTATFVRTMLALDLTYDAARDAFIAPKPHNSWLLDEDTCQWKAPIEYPTDGLMYEWDEELTDWKPIIKEIN
jgi:hypothetical protein